MGMLMSFMGKGSLSQQMLSAGIGTLYNQFVEKDIRDFDSFHIAILDIFNTVNMALPGKHYDAPPHKTVEELFEQWNKATGEDRKNMFVNFMTKNVNPSKVDNSMMITGIVAPPAAMVVKRTGETVPQLKVMKVVPDVVFVPSATILALITVKLSGRFFAAKMAS